MKKLQLDVDTISVEAFATGSSDKAAMFGTIHGNAATRAANCLTIRSDCTQPETVECPYTHDDNCM